MFLEQIQKHTSVLTVYLSQQIHLTLQRYTAINNFFCTRTGAFSHFKCVGTVPFSEKKQLMFVCVTLDITVRLMKARCS